MNERKSSKITVDTIVNCSVELVWKYWTEPEHIKKWNNSSEDWYTPKSENNLWVGGSFLSRMEARDGSMGFDFGGIYDEVKLYEVIAYTLGDGRKVHINFINQGDTTKIVETFDAESQNSEEMQKSGWQSILDNFKRYAEQEKK